MMDGDDDDDDDDDDDEEDDDDDDDDEDDDDDDDDDDEDDDDDDDDNDDDVDDDDDDDDFILLGAIVFTAQTISLFLQGHGNLPKWRETSNMDAPINESVGLGMTDDFGALFLVVQPSIFHDHRPNF